MFTQWTIPEGDDQLSCMLIDTEKEHGGPLLTKSEYDFPVIGKSKSPFQATLFIDVKGPVHFSGNASIILAMTSSR